MLKLSSLMIFCLSLLSLESKAQQIKITALGDILMHEALQIEATKQPDGFFALFKSIRPLLKESDIVYGNLEGPIAPGVLASGREITDPGFVYDGKVYSGTNFRFNYHPRLLADLERLGVQMVSTANNHTLDRGSVGVTRTIEYLRRDSRLAFNGTRVVGEDFDWTLTERQGVKIAWLSCTEHTNGVQDPFHQVLNCFDREDWILRKIAEGKKKFDLMILTPHWGEEYQTTPNERQKKWAHKMIEGGAGIIFGNHPHVIQPWEIIKDSHGRSGLVLYSLGNFIAWQATDIKKTSAVFTVRIEKSSEGVVLKELSWVPIYRGGLWVAPYQPSMGPGPRKIIEAIWGFENPVVLHSED